MIKRMLYLLEHTISREAFSIMSNFLQIISPYRKGSQASDKSHQVRVAGNIHMSCPSLMKQAEK